MVLVRNPETGQYTGSPIRRFHLLVFVVSVAAGCWSAMMAVHELGHVVGAAMTGGTVRQVVLHPLAISRTDVGANPYPTIAVWLGPVIGCVCRSSWSDCFLAVLWYCGMWLLFFRFFPDHERRLHFAGLVCRHRRQRRDTQDRNTGAGAVGVCCRDGPAWAVHVASARVASSDDPRSIGHYPENDGHSRRRCGYRAGQRVCALAEAAPHQRAGYLSSDRVIGTKATGAIVLRWMLPSARF